MKKTMENNKTLIEHYEFSMFVSQLEFNIGLLNYKLTKIKEFDLSDKSQQFEYLTIFDSIAVQIRAMFLEQGNKQYTFQNYFRNIGKSEIAQDIDNYLDSPFDAQNSRSIRIALKFITDKFICHFDKISHTDYGNANYIMATLSNPHSETNIITIFQTLIEIIGKNKA